MEDTIRLHVRAQLDGKSLKPLLDFVQEFLGHFRKVEALDDTEIKGDRDIKNDFAERFEGVLDRLRAAESAGD